MTDPKPGSPLWMRIVLVGSLAVNLLVAGVVIGAALKPDDRGGRFDRDVAGDLAPAPFVRALEEEDRQRLMEAFREGARAHRPDRRALRGQLETLLAALRSDSFDATVLTDLAERQRTLAQNRQAIGTELLAEYLSDLPPEARRAYADRLEEALRRGRRGP